MVRASPIRYPVRVRFGSHPSGSPHPFNGAVARVSPARTRAKAPLNTPPEPKRGQGVRRCGATAEEKDAAVSRAMVAADRDQMSALKISTSMSRS